MIGRRLVTEHPWHKQVEFRVRCLWAVASLLVNGPAAWAESLAVQASTVIEVTLRGEEVSGLTVEFASSVSGRQTDYAWSGVTDPSGRLELIVPGSDRSLVSGFYHARALTPAGEVVGRWRSIPINRSRRQALELVLDSGLVRRPPAGPGGALVAHYPLDGDARDVSGNAHHGAPSGVEPGEDRFGNESGAMLFRGTQDRIDLPHQVLDGLRDVSISFWLKTTKSGSQAILSAANQSNDNEHIVYLWDQENIHFLSHGTHGQGASFCWVDIPPIADGQWHHLVVVRNAAEGNAAFYVDGVGQTDRCGDLEYRALTVEEGGLIIGQEQDSLGGDFDPNQVLEGTLDDLRIYDKALSVAEVQTLLGKDGSVETEDLPAARPATLVAYYPFDGDADDGSGNGFDGTVYGPEPGEDRIGNESGAMLFRGTQDRIDLPHEVLDGLRDVSVSLWLKTTRSGQQAILGAANRSNDNEYLLYMMTGQRFRLISHGRFGRTQYECDVDVDPIGDGGWHHIVWVRNATGGHSDFYVDGAGQMGICGDLEYGALSIEEGGLIIGQEQDSLGGDFDPNQVLEGSLDDLRIYDGALTAAEVQALRGMVEPGGRSTATQEMAATSGLEPNAPNPFNTSTWVPYRLDTSGHVRLEIYNMLGQQVRVLVDGFQAAGAYRVRWDSRDGRGTAVASGVYLARLVHPGGVHSRRLLYLE